MNIDIEHDTANVEIAFNVFEFAVKLLDYIERGEVDLKKFDSEATFGGSFTLKSPTQADSFHVFPVGTFNTLEDMLPATKVLFLQAYASAAAALSDYLNVKFPLGNKNSCPEHDLRDLVYALRCTFAHDLGEARWRITYALRRRYSINGIVCDLTELNGEPFQYEHIGGFDKLMLFKEIAYSFVKACEPRQC